MKITLDKKRKLIKQLEIISLLLKCGGRGGKPGPCPIMSPSQHSHEVHFQEAATLAREKGYSTHINHSISTSSSYLSIGTKSQHGGLSIVAKVRISDHPKPGSKFGLDKKTNTLSLRTRDAQKAVEFIRSQPTIGGKGQIYDDSSGRGVFRDA